MSFTAHLIERYFERTGLPRDGARDAVYQWEWAILRDMLGRLEVILDDEQVPRETAERVLRCLLYGHPSAADADLRMQQDERITDLLRFRPPPPVVLPKDWPGLSESQAAALRDGDWNDFTGPAERKDAQHPGDPA